MPLPAGEIAALVDRHAIPLQLWIARRCRAPEDVVQEAFCRLATLRTSPDRPVAWLYTTVRNLAANHRLATRRRRRREEEVAALEVCDADPSERMQIAEALDGLGQLDDALREVVIARLWGELTLDEIGQLCGISTATASRRYRGALNELRRRLDEPCPNSTSATTHH